LIDTVCPFSLNRATLRHPAEFFVRNLRASYPVSIQEQFLVVPTAPVIELSTTGVAGEETNKTQTQHDDEP